MHGMVSINLQSDGGGGLVGIRMVDKQKVGLL